MDKPKVRCWSSFLGYPQVVTHVYVHDAEGLQNQDSTGGETAEGRDRQTSGQKLKSPTLWFHAGADPYVIIHCEGKKVRSSVEKDTLRPEFKCSAVFYRKKPRKPITVEVRVAITIDVILSHCHVVC